MNLKVEYNGKNCTGCRLCSVMCAFIHYESFNPKHGRIQVIKEEPDIDKPIVCNQCVKPKCLTTCPENAIAFVGVVVKINDGLCTGCGSCVNACPFRAIQLHPLFGKAIKCDLCAGKEPACVKFCPTSALELKK